MSPNPAATIFRLQASLCGTAIVSGVMLAGLFGASMFGIDEIAFHTFWSAHMFVHCAAVAISLTLLIHLTRELSSGMGGLYLTLLFLVFIVLFTSSLLPWTGHHSVTFDLPLTRAWIRAGRMADLPWWDASTMPSGIVPVIVGFFARHLTFLLPTYMLSYVLLLGGLTATLVYYKTHDEELSLWASVLAMSNPLVIAAAGEPANLLPAACFFGLAFGSAILWGEQKARWFWLIVPGLALGFAVFASAVSILYGAMLLLMLVTFYMEWRFSLLRALTSVAIIAVGALLGCSIWLFRSFVWSGKVFFPLLQHSGGHPPDVPFDPSLLGGLLFCGFAVIPLVRKSRHLHRVSPWARTTWAVALGGAVLTWYFVSRDLPEVILPVLMPMLVLAGVGLEQLAERKQANQGARYMRLFLACHFILLASISAWNGGIQRSVPFLFGSLPKPDYLEDALPGYVAVRAANRERLLPAGSGSFLIHTDLPLFYFKKKIVGVTYNGESLGALLDLSGDAKDFAVRLLLEGATHLIIGPDLDSPGNVARLSPRQRELWQNFLRDYAVRTGEFEKHAVFRIERPAGSM